MEYYIYIDMESIFIKNPLYTRKLLIICIDKRKTCLNPRI